MNWFWNLYAKFYDLVLFIPSYNQMLEAASYQVPTTGPIKLLDVGCGTGNFENLMLSQKGYERFSEVIGADHSLPMLRIAKKKNFNNRVSFIDIDLDHQLPFEKATFDVIVSINTLYAIKYPEPLLRQISLLLRDGGKFIMVNPKNGAGIWRLIVDTIHCGRIPSLLVRTPLFLLFFLANVFILRFGARNAFHFYTIEELREILERASLSPVFHSETYSGQALLVVARKVA